MAYYRLYACRRRTSSSTAVMQQWISTKQLFTAAMVTFLAGTLIAAFAPTFSFLLTGRIVQAFGTGLMMPLMMNTILIIFLPENAVLQWA